MTNANANPHRRFFLVAAAFNVVAGLALLFHRLWFELLGVRPNPESSFWIIMFVGLVLMLGYGYYLAAVDFERNRPIVQIGAIGKLWVFAIALGGFLIGEATWHLPAIASGDLVFAVMFIRILLDGAQDG